MGREGSERGRRGKRGRGGGRRGGGDVVMGVWQARVVLEAVNSRHAILENAVHVLQTILDSVGLEINNVTQFLVMGRG